MSHELSKNELFFKTKATKRLDKKLNRILHLPRKDEHEWSLASRPNIVEDWGDFYAGRLGQVALTELDNNFVVAQLVSPAGRASFTSPPVAYRPQIFFRLTPYPVTSEELQVHRYDPPGFLEIGAPFRDLDQYNLIVDNLKLQEVEVEYRES